MQVKFKNAFLKDFKKLPDDVKSKVGEIVFKTVPAINNIIRPT